MSNITKKFQTSNCYEKLNKEQHGKSNNLIKNYNIQ